MIKKSTKVFFHETKVLPLRRMLGLRNSIPLIEQLNDELFKLNEEPQPYVVNDKQQSYGSFFSNKIQVLNAIQKGVPFSFFHFLETHFPFSEAEWAVYLNVSTKTLQRNRKEENFYFKTIHSEKLLELAEVFYLGLSVFKSAEAFNQWFRLPIYSLNNLSPYNLIQTSYGQEFIADELNRIEHGVFA